MICDEAKPDLLLRIIPLEQCLLVSGGQNLLCGCRLGWGKDQAGQPPNVLWRGREQWSQELHAGLLLSCMLGTANLRSVFRASLGFCRGSHTCSQSKGCLKEFVERRLTLILILTLNPQATFCVCEGPALAYTRLSAQQGGQREGALPRAAQPCGRF